MQPLDLEVSKKEPPGFSLALSSLPTSITSATSWLAKSYTALKTLDCQCQVLMPTCTHCLEET